MNAVEIATLLSMVRALCPAQKLDEHTPDAWLFVLDDVPFDDARNALKTLGRTKSFISPADIHTEVRRVRNVRAGAYSDYADTLPNADPDDTAGYIAAIRRHNYCAASQLPERPVRQAIEAEFVYVKSTWHRMAVPMRALEAPKPPDPDFEAARKVLGALSPQQAQDFLTEARQQLEAEDVPLDHRAVAIRAAGLATRTDHTDQGA